MNKLLSFTLAIAILLVSCNDNKKDDDKPIRLRMGLELHFNDDPLALGIVHLLNDSTEIVLENTRFFLSHIRAVKQNGEVVELEEYAFMDIREPINPNLPNRQSLTFDLPSGNYSHLMMNLGLDSAQNYSDPDSYPIDHPLSTVTGMYWTWATQYRFLMIDGRANQPGELGTSDDRPFSYHPGGNHLYAEDVMVEGPFNVPSSATSNITLRMNVATWFDGPGGKIDPFTEFAAHDAPSEQPLAIKFMTNFADGLSF